MMAVAVCVTDYVVIARWPVWVSTTVRWDAAVARSSAISSQPPLSCTSETIILTSVLESNHSHHYYIKPLNVTLKLATMPKIHQTRFPITSPSMGKLPTCYGLVSDMANYLDMLGFILGKNGLINVMCPVSVCLFTVVLNGSFSFAVCGPCSLELSLPAALQNLSSSAYIFAATSKLNYLAGRMALIHHSMFVIA